MRIRTVMLFAALATYAANSGAAVRTIAYTGQQAPGTPSGALFDELYSVVTDTLPPVINNAGRIAFAAGLATGGGGVSGLDDTGIWSEGSGALTLVAREGSQAPGGPAGAVFRRVTNPALNGAGRIAFSGLMLEGTAGVSAANNQGIWSSGGGSLNLIAREGSPAPGAAEGVNFATLFDPNLSGSNQVAFRAVLSGTGVTTANDDGIWSQKAGTLGLVARAGNQAPGLAAGVNFNSFPSGQPVINGASQVAFRAFLAGAGVTTANDSSIWVERNGALTLAAREGAQAPGAPGASAFSVFTDPVLNNAGQTAFVAALAGGPIASNAGVWAESGNTLGLVALKGNAAPGTAAGVNFSSFSSPLLNSQGDVAFLAELAGGGVTTMNDSGVWARRDSILEHVAIAGVQAPGAPAGVNLLSIATPALNSAGQVAFGATLTGTGITTSNDLGIWAEGLDGQLQLVIREGDMIEVSPGQSRIVDTLYFAGGASNDDGRRSGFNNRGELAFLATFTDGSSGVFVSDAVKIGSADFDGDSDVDGADFLAWQRGVGTAPAATLQQGDANGDGLVNAADLTVWMSTHGTSATTTVGAAVPEPAAWPLAAIGAGLAISTCTRRRQ